MWELMVSAWQAELVNYPILLMQSAALLGVLSVVLMMSNASTDSLNARASFYGWTMGATGFVLIAMAFQLMNIPSKPYIGSDLLFMSGLLGGWRGGAIGWAMMVGARWLFGGSHQAAAFVLDMSTLVLAGVLMHQRIGHKTITSFCWQDIAAAWIARVAASVFASGLIHVLQLVPPVISARVFALRALGCVLSLLIIGCTLSLLRRDARQRESRALAFTMSRTDLLTGLPNRRALLEFLDRLLATDVRQHVVITFEVAHLQEMLRALGHDWTDRFWGKLAIGFTQCPAGQTLETCQPHCFQLTDLSLAVVLQGTSLERLERDQTASQLQAELVDIMRAVVPGYLPLQLRVGVFNVRTGAQANAASILRDLSLALQSNEQLLRYFHASFVEQAERDEDVRRMLIDWIRTANPPMQYQPKFDLLTRLICGAEALLRAGPLNGKPLAPLYVIEIATRNQLLSQFEWCTLEVVGRDIQRCLAAGYSLPFAVNISATTLTLPSFGDRVLALLAGLNVPPHLLSIEITESGQIPDVGTVRVNIAALHAAGVGLSLDDFGTGYSALTTLAKIPFTEVKIDHSMVSRIDQPRMRKAVSLALESATRYDATLVAEGVETEDQSMVLLEMGIVIAQGYLFSKAIPMDALLCMAGRDSPH